MTENMTDDECETKLHLLCKAAIKRIKRYSHDTMLVKFLHRLGEEEGINFLIQNIEILIPQESNRPVAEPEKLVMNEEQLNTFTGMVSGMNKRSFLKQAFFYGAATVLASDLTYRRIRGNNMGPAENKVTFRIAAGAGIALIVGTKHELHMLGLKIMDKSFLGLIRKWENENDVKEFSERAINRLEPLLLEAYHNIQCHGRENAQWER